MILPKKDSNQAVTKTSKTGINIKEKMNSTVVSNDNSVGNKVSTTTVKQQLKLQCRGQDFYNVFTTVEVNLNCINSIFHYFIVKFPNFGEFVDEKTI